MNVPKFAVIGPYKFKITIVKDLRDKSGDSCYGISDFKKQEIQLNADNPPQIMRSTLLHEIMHCALDMNYFDLDSDIGERIIRALDDCIVDTLCRTPNVGKFILGI